MPDLKISQFVDGGSIQPTDEIATVRSGVNTKAFVGTAAALDAGSSVGDVVAVVDVGGNAGLPSLDGSNLTGITVDASDVSYLPDSGSSITETNLQGAVTELDTLKLENITGLITTDSGSNVTITGSGTLADPYVLDSSGGGGGGFGTAAYEDVGTSIGNVVQLVNVGGNAGLPVVDGSNLTNLPAPSGTRTRVYSGTISNTDTTHPITSVFREGYNYEIVIRS